MLTFDDDFRRTLGFNFGRACFGGEDLGGRDEMVSHEDQKKGIELNKVLGWCCLLCLFLDIFYCRAFEVDLFKARELTNLFTRLKQVS